MSNPRKKYSNAQNVALLSQVSRVCPLCAEPLFYRKGGKSYKNYEIAHIYPLNPTPSEKILLEHEERLSNDVNDENNVIPLCEICHGRFDKPRTVEEYRMLFAVKKDLIDRSGQEAIWKRYAIEDVMGSSPFLTFYYWNDIDSNYGTSSKNRISRCLVPYHEPWPTR